jgi:hypothetical protein
VRWPLSKSRKLPSGLQETVLPLLLARKESCRLSPPALGTTHRLRKSRSPAAV